MKVCIHYSGKKRCQVLTEPLSIKVLEALTEKLFGLKDTRFVLYYIDEDEHNVVLIEQEDVQLCTKDQSEKTCELNVVSAETGLFSPRNTEIIKRMYLKALKAKSAELGASFNSAAELESIREYLQFYMQDQNIVTNIVDYLRNSIEMYAIESALSISCEGFADAVAVGSDFEGDRSGQDQISVSSITGRESSQKSFFTDASNDEIRKYGLTKTKIQYLNQLSEIPEDSRSILSNHSDDENRSDDNLPLPKPEDQCTHPTSSMYPDTRGRLSDLKKHKTDEGITPLFSSEISRPSSKKPASSSRIVARFTSFLRTIKNGIFPPK